MGPIENYLLDGEHIEYLDKNIGIIVSKTFTFTTDSLHLANFLKLKNAYRAADLCSGCGILPFLMAKTGKASEIFGFEINEIPVNQAKRSVELFNINNIKIIQQNIKDLKNENSFDIVSVNPPYFKDGNGLKNEDKNKILIRHTISCDLEDVASATKKLLKSNGKLFLCMIPQRLSETLNILSKYGLEPKVLKLIYKNQNSRPRLFLLQCIKNGKSGLQIEPPYFEYELDGTKTNEFKTLSKYYEKENLKGL
ncbi:MAG: tRNA1(Val) (adenine(37)-N6)-methyltransferase [Candidatus Fimenecus sp.]